MKRTNIIMIKGMSTSRVDLLLRVLVVLGLVEVTVHGLDVVAVVALCLGIILHDGGALTWLHHRQDLRETLTVLIIDNKTNVISKFNLTNKIMESKLTRAILSDGSLNGSLFQTW